MTSRALVAALLAAAPLVGCGAAAPSDASQRVALPRARHPGSPAHEPSSLGARGAAGATVDAEVLSSVASLRELPVRSAVRREEVSREEAVARILAKTRKEVPAHVLEAQGEFFAALGLAAPDYPFVEGMFRLLGDNLAGFYDPESDTLVLVEELAPDERGPTLTHELVHALQDQHFELGGRLDYARDKADEHAAIACLAEGDATRAMFPRAGAARPSPDALRLAMTASVALSAAGASAPAALQKALVAPYVDGYRFVEQLLGRGGWAEVSRAWRSPPETTEQVLHLDKFDARERPIVVAAAAPELLGRDWRELDSDVAGEQALRIVLEQWLPPPEAARAAAGWGGDRFAILVREDGAGRSVGLEWRIRFDDEKEAREAEELLRRARPMCEERRSVGPLAWRRARSELLFVAGPYRRSGGGSAEALPESSCRRARAWLAALER